MINDPQWFSILPPIIAIILAIKTKQVIPSLFAGIWIGCFLLNEFDPITGLAESFESIINVFNDSGDTKVLIFTLLIGALINTIEKSGGVSGFVKFLENNFYQYSKGMLDEEIWNKEKQYIEMQWSHCHLRHVYEGQVFMESFKEYVANLPDTCVNGNYSDGLIKKFN